MENVQNNEVMVVKKEKQKDNSVLLTIIERAIKLPGVKVDRDEFLRKQFEKMPEEKLNAILEFGPPAAGCEREVLRLKAKKLINDRTSLSTSASFLAGLPGGIAVAATIPADFIQFYGVALRLAQELAYLYGEENLWDGESINEEKVESKLILYCGVMLGVSGAAQAIKMICVSLGKTLAKNLPKKALTKTVYYGIIKSVCKAFGVNLTKTAFGKFVGKALPVVGGVVSGGLTYATMRPMGKRLAETFDNANYDYTPEQYGIDWEILNEEARKATENEEQSQDDWMETENEKTE